ncbi:MAG: orotidine-5'-phosphate decarboxylase [Deltaproteobacteria bacterium]|jgi:orotidine-5'-phosphate decarboxylase|nr:orotidine-5'-phosphate decarboxylase [Deltaproteobacteria bacterium]
MSKPTKDPKSPPAKSSKNSAGQLKASLAKVAFPLDSEKTAALKWVKLLGNQVGCLKVGLELFVSAGPSVLAKIRDLAPETKIFLDLKLNDIPATMAQATLAAVKHQVDYLTVHAQAGTEALKAVAAVAGPIKLLAVTVLTSLKPEELPELAPAYQEPFQWTLTLAQRALDAGISGLVTSPAEVAVLRAKFGASPFLVVPGIRPTWSEVPSDDQKRIGTPAMAIAAGADLLVVGRPIRMAKDPLQALMDIGQEIRERLFAA